MKHAKLKLLLAAWGLTVLSNVSLAQTTVDLVNGDFSLGGNGGGGFDAVAFDTPGWMNAGPVQNSSGNDSNIVWIKNDDDGAYQLSTNLIQNGDTFTLTWQAHDSWNASVQKVSLISGDATNTAYASTVELAAVTNALTIAATWPTYVLNYTAGPGDVGKHIGVYFNNVKVGSDSWANWDNFVMTVSPAGTPPGIVTPPDSQTVYEGAPVAFSVAASGTLPLSYQWKAGAVGSGVYTNINTGGQFSGATTATLTISNVQTANGLDYIVVVTNSSGTATGGPATLTVNPPVYVNGLFNGDFELPNTVKVWTGFDTPGANEVPGWKNTESSYADSGVEANPHSGLWCGYLEGGHTGAYQFSTNVLHQGDLITLSWWAQNAWNGGHQKVSLIAASSQDATYGTATEVTAMTNVLGAYIQYVLNYTAQAGDAGKYLGVYFANANPSTGNWSDFDDFSLLVTGAGAPPAIINPPGNQTVFLGATASFSVTASGNNLSYQWQAGAAGSGVYTNLSNGGQFSGVTTTNLVISNVQADNGADYIVVVSNPAGSTSNNPPATLTIDLNLPTVNSVSASEVYLVGDTVSLRVSATGAVSYQWQAGAVGGGVYTNLSNGGQFSGVNSTNLVISNAQKANTVDYAVVVSNGAGPATSSPITVTVLNKIYSETFDFPTGGTNLSVATVGWVGDCPNGNDRIYDATWGGQAVWSWNANAAAEAFYTKTSFSKTTFPGFNLSLVSNAVFMVGTHSQWAPELTHTYFAVQMNNGPWYVSTTELPQPVLNADLAQHSMAFDTNSASWNDLTVSGTGSTGTATIGSAATSNLSGFVSGVGLVLNHDGSSTVNFDNYRIAGDGIAGLPQVTLAPSGSNLQVSWTYGTLLEATNITGQWTTNSTATSPYVIPATGAQKFFRVQYP